MLLTMMLSTMLIVANGGQVTPPTILAPNAPYGLQWTHDGALSATFAEYVDTGLVKSFQPSDLTKSQVADATGSFTYTAAGVPVAAPGVHAIVVSASNICVPSGGTTPVTCEAKSQPASLLTAWTQAPNTPGSVKIIIIVNPGGGGVPPTVEVVKPGGGGGGQ